MRTYTDPDEAREIEFEDAHDARYGDREPDAAAAAAYQQRVAAHYRELLALRAGA